MSKSLQRQSWEKGKNCTTLPDHPCCLHPLCVIWETPAGGWGDPCAWQHLAPLCHNAPEQVRHAQPTGHPPCLFLHAPGAILASVFALPSWPVYLGKRMRGQRDATGSEEADPVIKQLNTRFNFPPGSVFAAPLLESAGDTARKVWWHVQPRGTSCPSLAPCRSQGAAQCRRSQDGS